MNKVQKALIGTALSATLIAGVGLGTYSSFNDSSFAGSGNTVAAETATLELNLYSSTGEVINEDTSFKLFEDEDGLQLLPGETAKANTFTVRNDGTRALDVGWMNSEFDFRTDLVASNQRWGYLGDSAAAILAPFSVEVTYTFLDKDGNVRATEVTRGSLDSNDLRQNLGKGQRNYNPLNKHKTFLPGESVNISLSLTLDEKAGNEYQGKYITSYFKVQGVQNNTADRN